MAIANLSDLSRVSKLISVKKYLNTTYRPDVDYVDGRIEERNLGEFDHGDLQTAISTMLRLKQKDWGVRVVVETRTQVAPTRFRIPDVCVEVLSLRDTLKRMRARVQDFFDMGVQTIWILDPDTRTAHLCTATEMTAHTTGTLRVPGTPIEAAVEEIFATLDT